MSPFFLNNIKHIKELFNIIDIPSSKAKIKPSLYMINIISINGCHKVRTLTL